MTKDRDPGDAEFVPLLDVDPHNNEDLVTINFSGNTINSGLADATSGVAIHYRVDDHVTNLPVDLEQSTANAEIAVALLATQKTDTDAPLCLESTRDTVLKAITTTQ